MRLAPFVFASGLLVGIANASGLDSPNVPGHPGHGMFQTPVRVERPPPRGFHIERGINEQVLILRRIDFPTH